MKDYICIVTNENQDIKNYFIKSATFHSSFMEAKTYGKDLCKSLNGLSDYFIYRNLSPDEERFLGGESVPF